MFAVVLPLCIPAIPAIYYFFFYRSLESRWESRQEFRKNLGNTGFKQNYIAFLARCLDWLSYKKPFAEPLKDDVASYEKRLGAPWSWRAWQWSFMIAYAYPIAFALLAWWGANVPLALGGEMVLPPTSIGWRWLVIALLLALSVYMLNLRRVMDALTNLLGKQPQRRQWSLLITFLLALCLILQLLNLPLRLSFGLPAIFLVFAIIGFLRTHDSAFAFSLTISVAFSLTIFVAFSLAIFVSVFGAFSVAFSVAISVAFSFAIFIAIFVAFSGASTVIFAISVAGAIFITFSGSILVAFSGDILTSAMLAFFYLLLPFFNSILDYISLSCSRWLSHNIVKLEHKHWYLAPLHFLVDALLALLFLLGLAALLPLASKLLNAIYRQEVINWLDFAKSAWQDPWGSGFFVTAMLLSTLVPTLIHLFIALAAFCLPKYPDSIRQWLITRLDNPDFANFSHQSIAKEAAVLMAMWAIPFLMFAALCWLLGWVLLALDQPIWHAVYRVAVWADGLF